MLNKKPSELCKGCNQPIISTKVSMVTGNAVSIKTCPYCKAYDVMDIGIRVSNNKKINRR
jgi:predicted  nucleic acid-binding Zn-ribbon protein